MKRFFYAIYLAAAPNVILLIYKLYTDRQLPLMAAAGLFFFALWLKINLRPIKLKSPVSARLKIMENGRFLIYCGLYGFVLQAILLIASNRALLEAGFPGKIVFLNVVWSVGAVFLLLANGVIRIFCTSRRLSILRRIMMLLTMWVPIVNLLVLLYACRLVYEEYDFEVNKALLRATRVDSDLCKTKYPLVMVHGIGFRDIRYFNYWGRIPRELIRNGATIYYGNQEALGTIVHNAHDIRDKIQQVLEETGSEKVNIIAHSKGGLDSRYAITMLGLGDQVASLTTMNTPHRGCRFVDVACKLPDGLYRFVAGCFDRTFRKFGDEEPDFYTATRQFSTMDSDSFNQKVADLPQVYYQSYTSAMSSLFSDSILSLTYCMIKPLEGKNDGLVSVESAKWGNFKGTFETPYRRGISHGDIIDLKREDYKGFDVLEQYISMVSELKRMGF